MERKMLIDKIKYLPKDTEVYVWDIYSNKYTNHFHVWQEGHDHRHFIDLEKLSEIHYPNSNKNYTVGELIKDIGDTYDYYSNEYADTITVNVANKKGENTSNIDVIYKNGKVYFVGRVPNWKKWRA